MPSETNYEGISASVKPIPENETPRCRVQELEALLADKTFAKQVAADTEAEKRTRDENVSLGAAEEVAEQAVAGTQPIRIPATQSNL